MFIALAWTVGPAFAAWVMVHFSYRGLFLCAAADFLLFACVVWRYVPAVPPIALQGRSSGRQPLLDMLRRGDVLAHVMAFVLITASTTIGMMNLPLFIMKTLHGNERNVGLAYSVAPMFELPLMLYFGWLATKHAPDRIIRLGMAFGFAYYVTLVLVAAPWHVYLCQLVSAATIAVIAGVAITYFQRHLPHHPGTATNLYANAQRVGSTAGYFMFVLLVSRFGHRAVFEACAGFALVALGLMFVPIDVPPEEPASQRRPGLPVA
jgi:SET family sugar efflux transporter-like MFS transporter